MNISKNGSAIATVGNPYNGQLATPTDFEVKLKKITGLSPNQSRDFIEWAVLDTISLIAESEALTLDRAVLKLYREYLDSQNKE